MIALLVAAGGAAGAPRDGPLAVKEFHSYEPNAYVHDVDYFISLDGTVYGLPENKPVGYAPELQDAAARAESHAKGLAEMARDEYDEEWA